MQKKPSSSQLRKPSSWRRPTTARSQLVTNFRPILSRSIRVHPTIMMGSAPFLALPIELLTQIIGFLEGIDILRMRQVSDVKYPNHFSSVDLPLEVHRSLCAVIGTQVQFIQCNVTFSNLNRFFRFIAIPNRVGHCSPRRRPS